MRPTIIAAIILVAALILAGGYWLLGNETNPPASSASPSPSDNSPFLSTPSPYLESFSPSPSVSDATPAPTLTPTPRSDQTVTVTIAGFAFNPTPLTIKVNDTVKWLNQDSVPHQITSDANNAFSSPNFSQGQSYSFKFTVAGTYPYYCGLHPNMRGSIIVAP